MGRYSRVPIAPVLLCDYFMCMSETKNRQGHGRMRRLLLWAAVLVIIVVLAIGVVVQWLAPSIGTALAERTFRDMGFSDVKAEVLAVTSRTLVLGKLQLGDGDRRISAERVVVRYSSAGLRKQRIEWIELQAARLHVGQTEMGEWEIRGFDTFLSNGGEDGWTFGELRIVNSDFILHAAGQEIPVPFSGIVTFGSGADFSLALELAPYGNRAKVQARVATEPQKLEVDLTFDRWQLADLRPALGELPFTWLHGRLSGSMRARSAHDQPLEITGTLTGNQLHLQAPVAEAGLGQLAESWSVATMGWQAESVELSAAWTAESQTISLRLDGREHTLFARDHEGREMGRFSYAGIAVQGATSMEEPLGPDLVVEGDIHGGRLFAIDLESGQRAHQSTLRLAATMRGVEDGSLEHRVVLEENHWKTGEVTASAATITVAGSMEFHQGALHLQQHTATIAGLQGHYANAHWEDVGIEVTLPPDGAPMIVRAEAPRFELRQDGMTIGGNAWRVAANLDLAGDAIRVDLLHAPVRVTRDDADFLTVDLTGAAHLSGSGAPRSWSIDTGGSLNVAGMLTNAAVAITGDGQKATLHSPALKLVGYEGFTVSHLTLTMALPAAGEPWSARFGGILSAEPAMLTAMGAPLAWSNDAAPIELNLSGSVTAPPGGALPDWRASSASIDLAFAPRLLRGELPELRVSAESGANLTLHVTPEAIDLSGRMALTLAEVQAGAITSSSFSATVLLDQMRVPLFAGYHPASLELLSNRPWLRENLQLQGSAELQGGVALANGEIESISLALPLRWQGEAGFGDDAPEGHLRVAGATFQGMKLEPLELALRPRGQEVAMSGVVTLPTTELRVEVTSRLWFSAGELLASIPFTSTIADLAQIKPLLQMVAPSVFSAMRLRGSMQIQGEVTLGPEGLGGETLIGIRDGDLQNTEIELRVTELAGELRIANYWPLATPTHQRLTFGPSVLAGLPTGGGELIFQLEPSGVFFLESAMLHLLGGTMRSYATRIRPEMQDFEIELWAEQLELSQLFALQQVVQGTATGLLYGKIPLRFQDGRLMQVGGYLFTPPSTRGSVRLTNAEALLSQMNIQDQRMNMVRQALQNLDYDFVRLDMEVEPGREAVINLRMHGKSADKPDLPPIHLNTRITGAIRELINTGLFLKEQGISLE